MKEHKVSIAVVKWRPLGRIWLAAGPDGLARVHLGGERREFLALLEKEGFAPVVGKWAREAAGQVSAYLQGKRRSFSLRLSPGRLTPFQRRIYRQLARVRYAELVTYGELAARAGVAGAARAVGRAMAVNPLPLVWPCHRVVGRSGLVGFGGGLEAKQALIRLEARAAAAAAGR